MAGINDRYTGLDNFPLELLKIHSPHIGRLQATLYKYTFYLICVYIPVPDSEMTGSVNIYMSST